MRPPRTGGPGATIDRLIVAVGLGRRRWPLVTTIVLLTTAATSCAQLLYHPVFYALHRDPDALAAGEWWRVATWMFVQDGWLAGTVVNLVALSVVGTVFEWMFGPARWLLTYFVSGLIGQIPGFVWNPYGAGNSVPVAVMLGALVSLLAVAPPWFGVPLPWQLRVWVLLAPVLAVLDTVARDNHGMALLLGVLLGAVMLRLQRHRADERDRPIPG